MNRMCTNCVQFSKQVKVRTWTTAVFDSDSVTKLSDVTHKGLFCPACWQAKQASLKVTFSPQFKRAMYVLAAKYLAVPVVLITLAIGWASYNVDQSAWWIEGTKAYREVMQGEGQPKPCDYENDKNCEVG